MQFKTVKIFLPATLLSLFYLTGSLAVANDVQHKEKTTNKENAAVPTCRINEGDCLVRIQRRRTKEVSFGTLVKGNQYICFFESKTGPTSFRDPVYIPPGAQLIYDNGNLPTQVVLDARNMHAQYENFLLTFKNHNHAYDATLNLRCRTKVN